MERFINLKDEYKSNIKGLKSIKVYVDNAKSFGRVASKIITYSKNGLRLNESTADEGMPSTDYLYDTNDNLLSIYTDNKNFKEYTYDDKGRVASFYEIIDGKDNNLVYRYKENMAIGMNDGIIIYANIPNGNIVCEEIDDDFRINVYELDKDTYLPLKEYTYLDSHTIKEVLYTYNENNILIKYNENIYESDTFILKQNTIKEYNNNGEIIYHLISDYDGLLTHNDKTQYIYEYGESMTTIKSTRSVDSYIIPLSKVIILYNKKNKDKISLVENYNGNTFYTEKYVYEYYE